MLKSPPVVGQQVGFCRGERYSVGHTVKTVTPSGQIVVISKTGHEYRFNSDGREMGSGRSYFMTTYLLDAEEAELMIKLNEGRQAFLSAINRVYNQAGSNQHMTRGDRATYLDIVSELERLVAEARMVAESMGKQS